MQLHTPPVKPRLRPPAPRPRAKPHDLSFERLLLGLLGRRVLGLQGRLSLLVLSLQGRLGLLQSLLVLMGPVGEAGSACAPFFNCGRRSYH